MGFKFEKLEVWQLSMELSKEIYLPINDLPTSEKFNLSSRIRRAATSISLNIAEGSTSQSDPEQLRFLGYAHRSLMETVACLMLMEQNKYINTIVFSKLYSDSEKLSAKILAMRNSIKRNPINQVNEKSTEYGIDND